MPSSLLVAVIVVVAFVVTVVYLIQTSKSGNISLTSASRVLAMRRNLANRCLYRSYIL